MTDQADDQQQLEEEQQMVLLENIHSILFYIQQNLKAPKGQYNSFGKYRYRSYEDILTAVKPLLNDCAATLDTSYEPVLVGEWHYIKATVTIEADCGRISAAGYAREQETKKGMDASQITGTAGSYAAKYAANGLFAIDDTKDADATNDHKDEGTAEKASQDTVKALSAAETLDALAEVWQSLSVEERRLVGADGLKKYKAKFNA
jgi:hypothetical protein